MTDTVNIGKIIHNNLQEILEGTHHPAADRLRAAELLANDIVPRTPEEGSSEQVAQCVLSAAQFEAIDRYINAIIEKNVTAVGHIPPAILDARVKEARARAINALVNGGW